MQTVFCFLETKGCILGSEGDFSDWGIFVERGIFYFLRVVI